jgi:DNA-binding response OmpR family regulator
MKILVAEDDEVSLNILLAQLRHLDHEVRGARDGREALGGFEQANPEVVITDWLMPGMDGLELCRSIRRMDRKAYTYIVLLTSQDRKVGFLEAMKAGADDFVNKPCDTVELNVRLRVAQRIVSLQTTVTQLEGLLPICPQCRRIKTAQGVWQPVEQFISRTTAAQFSHGICPTCYETRVKPEMERLRGSTQPKPGRSPGVV